MVMQPESVFKATWDLVGFFFIVYQSIAIPFVLCFEYEPDGAVQFFHTV